MYDTRNAFSLEYQLYFYLRPQEISQWQKRLLKNVRYMYMYGESIWTILHSFYNCLAM